MLHYAYTVYRFVSQLAYEEGNSEYELNQFILRL